MSTCLFLWNALLLYSFQNFVKFMGMVERKISDLNACSKNPRLITKKQYELLENSLKKFGDISGIVFNVANQTLVGGHMRQKVFKSSKAQIHITEKFEKRDDQGTLALGYVVDGDKKYPYREVDFTDEEHDEAMVGANKLGGEFDFDMLANNWDQEWLEDKFEFDKKDFGIMMHEDPEETKGDDEIPENVAPLTVRGDLYELGPHRVLCGDSTIVTEVENLMDGKKAEMVFTDPPYGVSYQSNMRTKSEKFEGLKNDDSFITEWIPLLDIFSNGFVFIWTSWKVIGEWLEITDGNLGKPNNIIVWNKGGGGIGDLEKTFSSDYELAMVWHRGSKITGKRIGSVWEVGKDGASTYEHPKQKPVDLCVTAVQSVTKRDNVVLDLFLGSGSTLIGCEKTNVKCYGMELDERYCDVIVKRYIRFCQKNNREYSVKRNGSYCKDFDDDK